ncbi:hypothetical protein IWW45_006340 [Coemansia sp. RSA 485]|nr:hypothetical protein IWW45_006340 [Coemansia sp. RSA 485]
MVYDDVVKNIITSSMSGFNGTIFAYGQTSSGKTHTMYGGDSEDGIIKLAVKNMFSFVETDPNREYLIRVSFLEIYNEVLRDLLEPAKTNLKIHENAKHEIFVGDLSEHIVFNAEQVEEILAKGDRNRQIGGTNMNERSSRSHTIFRIVVESRDKAEMTGDSGALGDADALVRRQQRLSTGSAQEPNEFTGAVMVSCLNLVDLAGSERVGQTGAEGQRLKEGAHINKSLLSLGTVIARLSEDGGDRGHIPYRDSKITRILQPSLGGNAKTLIICTITPSPDYVDETLSTLKFASRAKTIKNKPEVNEELRGDALLRRLKRASELEKEVAQMKEIEQKKLKIEADNESLLRQLWKSQKERDRLQRELVKQQANMFLPRQAEVKDSAADPASAVRRQTWFPGLQAPFVDDGSSADTGQQELSVAPVTESGGDAMDTDTAAVTSDSNPADQRAASIAVTDEMHQAALEQINELRLKSDCLQQERDDMLKSSKEMEDTIQRYMREYNLLLSTLNQLAAAEIIPPSPAKPIGGSPSEQQQQQQQQQPPRELVQIRRKLRALMTTIDASQRMCQKFRSQRPEAEFLEMELQATRETLLQKEEELVEILRESDELFAKFRETETELEESQTACQQMRVDLDGAGVAQERLEKAREDLAAMLEQERQQFSAQLQAQSMDSERHTNDIEKSFNLKISELETQISQQAEEAKVRYAQHADREQELLTDLESARAAALSSEQTVSSLETRLSEATAQLDAYKDRCDSLEESSAGVAEKTLEINQLKSLVEELQLKSADYATTIDGLRALVTEHETAVSDKGREAEQLYEKISSMTAAMAALELRISDSESAHQAELLSHEASLSLLRETSANEKSALEQKLAEATFCAESLRAEVSTLGDKLDATEKELASAVEDLRISNQQASQAAGIAADMRKLNDDLASLRSDYNKALADLESKQTELDRAVEERDRVGSKIDELENQNADVWDRVSELTVSNNDLTTDLMQSKKTIDDKDQRIGLLENALAEAADGNDSLKCELDQLTKSHSDALERVESANKDIEQRLELANKQLKEDGDRWEAAIASLNSQLAAAEQKLHAATDEYEQRIDQITAREASANDRIKQLEASLQSSQTQLASLRQDLEKTDISKSNVAELNADLSKQLETQFARVSDLETQLEAAQESLAKTRQEHADLATQMTQKSTSWDQERISAREKIDQLLVDIESTRAQLDNAHKARLAEKAEMEDSIRDNEQRIKQLQQSISEKDAVGSELQTQLANKSHEHELAVSDLRSQVDELNLRFAAKQKELDSGVAAAKEARRVLQAQLDELAAKHSDTCRILSEAERSRDSIRIELENQKEHTQRMSLSADQSSKLLEDIQEKHNAQVGQLQESIDTLTLDKDQVQQKSVELQDMLNSTNDELHRLKSVLSYAENRYADLEKEHNSAMLGQSDLQSKLEAKCAEVDVSGKLLSEQILLSESCKEQIAKLQQSVDEKQGRISELESDLQRFIDSQDAASDKAKVFAQSAEQEILSLKQAVAEQRVELSTVQQKLTETVDAKEQALSHASELQGQLEIMSRSEADSGTRLVQLDAKLNEQQELVLSLREHVTQFQGQLLQEQGDNAERSAAAQENIDSLSIQISDKESKIQSLEDKLRNASQDAAAAHKAHEKAEAEHRTLMEQAKESQERLEQELSETKRELSRKDGAIGDLESALETAKSTVSVSQTKAQEEALATIDDLRKRIAISENELSETRSALDDSRLNVETLEQECDKVASDIETLKHMMVELAGSKDKDIIQLEETLRRQEELLEASVRETVEKEEAAQLAEKLAATHLERATKAESDLEQAAKSSKETIERLAKERLELEKTLEAARLLETELRKKQSSAESEVSRLQLEIEQHEQAESDLEKSLELMSDDLAKAQEAGLATQQAKDQILSAVQKELIGIVKKLAALPGCKSVEVPDAAISDAAFDHQALFAIAHELVSATESSSLSSEPANNNAASGSSLQLEDMRSEIDRLRVLNEKLEKKNVKLLDMYKADVTGLHEQEEKHRKRADALTAELGENASKTQATEQQLAEIKDELEKQQKQRLELEATIVQLTTKAAIAVHRTRTAETPTTPIKQVSSRPSTPDTGSRNGASVQTPGHTKAALARLASQCTPMKSENKRVHTISKPEAMLSPVSSSVLNARLAASAVQDESQQTPRYSLRKRTAVNSENNGVPPTSATVSVANAAAAGATAEPVVAKVEAMRTRSTYGDRRRNRRNQPAVRNDGLDEQAAEQCAQQ